MFFPLKLLAMVDSKGTAANIEVFRPWLAGASEYPGAYVLLRVAAALDEKEWLNDRSYLPQRDYFPQKASFYLCAESHLDVTPRMADN